MEMKQARKTEKKNSKKLIAILVALLALVGSTGAFAFWDELTAGSNEVVTIGEGVTLTRSESVTDAAEGATLIPATAVLKPGDIKSIEFTYEVALDKESVEDLLFDVQVSNVKIGGSSEYAGLINFVIENPEFINSDTETVTIVVTITEPETFEAYSAVANQEITFDVLFTSAQNLDAAELS
jgi:hypothetical protein